MALMRQNVSISFNKGLNQKVDGKQLPLESLDVLENAVFKKSGKISKRNGYDILSNYDLNNNTINSAQALASFRDELNLFTNNTLYSYAEGLERWIEKGDVISTTLTSDSIIRNSYTQSNPAYAFGSGLSVYAWTDERGGIRYSVLDESTKAFLVSDTQIHATGTSPRLEYIGNNFVLLFIDSLLVKRIAIPVTNPSQYGTVSTISGALNASATLDTTVSGARLFYAYNANAGVEVRYLTPALGISSEITKTGNASTAISISADEDGQVCVSWSNSTDVRSFTASYDLDTSSSVHVQSTANAVRITSTAKSANSYIIFYEISAASDYNRRVLRIDYSSTGFGTESTLSRALCLYSNAFTHNGLAHVVTGHKDDPQSTYFVLNEDSKTVSKIALNLAAAKPSTYCLSQVKMISEGVYKFPNELKGKLFSDGTNVYSEVGLQATKIDFTASTNFRSSELGYNLHVVGGLLNMYDGNVVVEHGFNMYPLAISAAEDGAGALGAGTYQYQAIYEWTDNYGQVHYSSPSIPVSLALGASKQASVVVSTLRLTEKADVTINLYRTEAYGTILYKVASTPNNKTVDTVTFSDNMADATIITKELIYTTGGTLENIAPPSNSFITTFKNRVILGGLEDENVIWFSKIRNEGEPVEFSDILTKKVDRRGGKITALGVLDDKLVIFTERAVYIMVGDGPNNLGEQDNFSEPTLVTSDTGCNNPNSLVLTPAGLMFKSEKGIYLLDRSLAVQYIGSPVEDFNNVEIVSAQLIPYTNQVRFITTGKALVYDYFFNQWSTFTNHEAVDAEIWKGNFLFVRSNGLVYLENPEKFKDGNTRIRLKIVTGWINLAGVQGYKRIYTALLLGEYKGSHILRAKVAYDYNESFVHNVDINAGALLENEAYGDQVYGEDLYGGVYPTYQWQINPKIQKCEAIKLSFEDTQVSNFNEGFDLSNLLLVVGTKEGTNKLRSNRTYGLN